MRALILFTFFVFITKSSSEITNKYFPKNFKFGASTAAYQIEGAWNEDGRGESIWDRFIHEDVGRIINGSNADIACNSYHLYTEDIKQLSNLGAQIYRFSISWSRILPDGTTRNVNQAGVKYYMDLLKELKRKKIEPIITIYHWDLPQYLEDLGGWLNPQISDYFAAYARYVFDIFGPHVKYFITLNEPTIQCIVGYAKGEHAPGKTLKGDGVYQCIYVQLLAHAKAWHIYNNEFRFKYKGKVGLSYPQNYFIPYNASDPKDLEATERAYAFNAEGFLGYPVYKGDWSPVLAARVAQKSKEQNYTFSRLPKFSEEEIKLIKGTSDFLAVNHYTTKLIKWSEEINGDPDIDSDKSIIAIFHESWTTSTHHWLSYYPEGLRGVLVRTNKTLNPGEIIIAENGWADVGGLNDTVRMRYIQGNLDSVSRAIFEDGINVSAYSVWSLLDNFEWNSGYSQKMGIIQVDFNDPNRTRTWKDSARYYQKVITTRCLLDNCDSNRAEAEN